MRALILAALLAGCAAMPMQRATLPPVPPHDLQSCRDGARLPMPPPSPRSVASLARFAENAYAALITVENERNECADRLTRLNEWIVDHQL